MFVSHNWLARPASRTGAKENSNCVIFVGTKSGRAGMPTLCIVSILAAEIQPEQFTCRLGSFSRNSELLTRRTSQWLLIDQTGIPFAAAHCGRLLPWAPRHRCVQPQFENG